MDLNHDAMTALESVIHVLHGEVDFFNLVGSERLGLFETVAEFSAEGFAVVAIGVERTDEALALVKDLLLA